MWTLLTIKIIYAYTGFNCGTQFKDLAGEKLKRQIIDVHELFNGSKPYVYRTSSRVAIISPGIGLFNYINQLSDVSLNKSNLLWFFLPHKKVWLGQKNSYDFFRTRFFVSIKKSCEIFWQKISYFLTVERKRTKTWKPLVWIRTMMVGTKRMNNVVPLVESSRGISCLWQH